MDHKLTIEEAYEQMYASRTDMYTVPIANGFYMEFKKAGSDTVEVVGDEDIFEVSLCRDEFPLKVSWILISLKKGCGLEAFEAVAAKLLVEDLIEEDELGPLWELLYDNEIVTICPCCGMPEIGTMIEPGGDYNGLHLVN